MVIIIILIGALLIAYLLDKNKVERDTQETIRRMYESDKRAENVLKSAYTPKTYDEPDSCFHGTGGACQGCHNKYAKD